MSTIRAITLVAVFQMISGCMVTVEDPNIEIMIHQRNGRVSFEFFVETRSWWSKQTLKRSTKVGGIIVGTTNSILWEIQEPTGTNGVLQIVYGDVPKGFNQLVPKAGDALPLKPGSEYEVWAIYNGMGKASFVYKDNN